MRLLIFILAGACIYLALRPRAEGEGDSLDLGGAVGGVLDLSSFEPESIVNEITAAARAVVGNWRPPAKYAQAIMQAEDDNGIPRDILARLLYQESHWREDIITGRKRSSVGAVGIAQFMPATAAERGLNPLDPYASIAEAGRYLAWLRTRHSNWTEAVAAYNWGTGNVARKGLVNAPLETRNYFTEILGDVNASNGTGWT